MSRTFGPSVLELYLTEDGGRVYLRVQYSRADERENSLWFDVTDGVFCVAEDGGKEPCIWLTVGGPVRMLPRVDDLKFSEGKSGWTPWVAYSKATKVEEL